MKLFIPRRHLYTASTWAFSYQNKSYQGQVIVFFTHTSTFRLTAEDFKSERHDTDDSIPSTRWFIQLEKPSVTQICRPLLVQLVVQTVISPLACPFTMKSTHYNEHTVHNESDDTREWYIHLWPPGESRDCSPPPREEQRRHQDGEREREHTHTQQKEFSNKHAGLSSWKQWRWRWRTSRKASSTHQESRFRSSNRRVWLLKETAACWRSRTPQNLLSRVRNTYFFTLNIVNLITEWNSAGYRRVSGPRSEKGNEKRTFAFFSLCTKCQNVENKVDSS